MEERMNKFYVAILKGKEDEISSTFYHVFNNNLEDLLKKVKEEKVHDYNVYEMSPKLIKEMTCQRQYLVEDTFDKEMKEIINE